MKVLFIQLSFLCVQLRYNYMYCYVNKSFVFLIIGSSVLAQLG